METTPLPSPLNMLIQVKFAPAKGRDRAKIRRAGTAMAMTPGSCVKMPMSGSAKTCRNAQLAIVRIPAYFTAVFTVSMRRRYSRAPK